MPKRVKGSNTASAQHQTGIDIFFSHVYLWLALFLILSYFFGWLRFINTCTIETEAGSQVEKKRKNLRFQLGPVDLNILTFGGDRKLSIVEGIERDCKNAEEPGMNSNQGLTEEKDD